MGATAAIAASSSATSSDRPDGSISASASGALVAAAPSATASGGVGARRDSRDASFARLAEPGELDDRALAECIDTEARLEVEVVGRAEPRVRGPQSLAGRRRITFRGTQPITVGDVGGVDLVERPACGRLAFPSRGEVGTQRVASLDEVALTTDERGHVPFRPGQAFLGEQGRGLGACATVFGVASDGFAGRGIRRPDGRGADAARRRVPPRLRSPNRSPRSRHAASAVAGGPVGGSRFQLRDGGPCRSSSVSSRSA